MDIIKGYVDHIVYQSDSGYTVFQMISEGDEITCVGTLKGLTVGETVEQKVRASAIRYMVHSFRYIPIR